MRELIIDSLRW